MLPIIQVLWGSESRIFQTFSMNVSNEGLRRGRGGKQHSTELPLMQINDKMFPSPSPGPTFPHTQQFSFNRTHPPLTPTSTNLLPRLLSVRMSLRLHITMAAKTPPQQISRKSLKAPPTTHKNNDINNNFNKNGSFQLCDFFPLFTADIVIHGGAASEGDSTRDL